MSFDHTERHTTVGRTPLDEGSARRRGLPENNTQHSQETNIHAPGGIRTLDPSKRAAEDPRLRPRGHWILRYYQCVICLISTYFYASLINVNYI
jgi:hypothetical protein